MARGNQREKAREKNQKEAAGQVGCISVKNTARSDTNPYTEKQEYSAKLSSYVPHGRS